MRFASLTLASLFPFRLKSLFNLYVRTPQCALEALQTPLHLW